MDFRVNLFIEYTDMPGKRERYVLVIEQAGKTLMIDLSKEDFENYKMLGFPIEDS